MTRQAFAGAVPQLGQRVYVAESAHVIGDVCLDDDVSVWPGAVVRGDVNHIHVGAGTNVQDGCVLHVTHSSPYTGEGFALTIGQFVTLGHRVVAHGCRIGNLCLLGIGAIVMDGAVLENEIILGAGALVPPGKHLEGGYLYVGVPARQVRPLSEQEREFLRYSAEHYIELKNRYLNP
ncbi:MAG: gamma carbonic anhydrase family protein [Methylohalobius sp.]|nr:gamma carbonic anhydrase family protein [Methylohalobius sp.]